MPLLHCTTAYTTALSIYLSQSSRAGSGVVRIDPLRFLAGCRKRRLNQALSVLPLSLGFFRCMCCARDQGLFLGCVIFYIICVRYVSWLFLLRCQLLYQCKWLTGKTRLLDDPYMGTLNPTHSLAHSLTIYVSGVPFFFQKRRHMTFYEDCRLEKSYTSQVSIRLVTYKGLTHRKPLWTCQPTWCTT